MRQPHLIAQTLKTASILLTALALCASHSAQAQTQGPTQQVTIWPHPYLSYTVESLPGGVTRETLATQPTVGDTPTNSVQQAFFGYGFTGHLPEGAIVTQATLTLTQPLSGGTVKGKPYTTSGLGRLWLELGTWNGAVRAINPSAPTPPNQLAFTDLTPSVKTLDVTAMVASRVVGKFPSINFRARFDKGSNGDAVSDGIQLQPGQLNITYKLPTSSKLVVFSRSSDPFTSFSSLCVMNADGSGARQLTPGDRSVDDRMSAWSPDGQKIVFTRFVDNTDQQDLFVVNADGTGLRQLTKMAGQELNPSWSPDGQKICFTARGNGADVWMMNADGSSAHMVADVGEEWRPSWSPDGQWIAFSSSGNTSMPSGLYLVQPSGAGLRFVTSGGDPTWMPDGTHLLFSRGYSGLYMVGLDGSELHQVTAPPARTYDMWPSVSADGYIYFHSNRPTVTEQTFIFRCRLDGSALTQLTNTTVSDYEADVQ